MNAFAHLSRRQMLAGAALASTALAAPGLMVPALERAGAAAPKAGAQEPGFYRFKVGDFEVTAINDGTWFRKLTPQFVRNAPIAEVQDSLTAGFLPPDALPVPFTALVVNTGSRVLLFDTGTGAQFGSFAPQSGSFAANLAAAGIDPDSVDAVYISHFHPDHINGLKTRTNEPTFPNASINVPDAEWAFWMDDGNMTRAADAAEPTFKNARRVFDSIEYMVEPFGPESTLESGVTSIPAPGHTPGHTAYVINSGNQSLLYVADTAFHPFVFVRHPEWQIAVDMDGNQAVETRRKIFDLAVADRMLTHGYHWSFPGTGHLARLGDGYDMVPIMWQPTV